MVAIPGATENPCHRDYSERDPTSRGAADSARTAGHPLALTVGTGNVDTVLVDGEVVMRAGRSSLVDEAKGPVPGYRTERAVAEISRVGTRET